MPGRRPKLCVITTGGTIGMVRDAGGIAHPPSLSEGNQPESTPSVLGSAEAFDAFPGLREVLGDRYELHLLPLMSLDSTNVLPADWSAIAQAVHRFDPHEFDGLVVTHGTDTLAHSAAAVAFALGPPPLPMPVVFTGAMRTPGDPGYDGLENLAAACRAAASDLGEVAVAFHRRLLRGTRVQKISATELDAFTSPGLQGLGEFNAGEVELHADAVRRSEPDRGWPEPFRANFARGIATVVLTPGLDPAIYESLLDERGCRGVVLTALGAGHVPDRPGADWTRWIARASEADIPVVLLSPFFVGRTDRSDYAVGRGAVESGAIPLADLTEACVHAKLSHLIAEADAAGAMACPFVRQGMTRNDFGELGGPIRGGGAL